MTQSYEIAVLKRYLMETESESSVNVSGGDTAGDNEASEAVTELNIDPEPDIEVP